MKNKIKWYWNFFQMFEESSKKVVQMQTVWGGLIGFVLLTSWATESASSDALLIVSVVAYVVNKLIGGFYFEDETYKGKL
jgi:hypothetical protein